MEIKAGFQQRSLNVSSLFQTHQTIVVQLLQSTMRLLECPWLQQQQKSSVEACIRTLAMVGKEQHLFISLEWGMADFRPAGSFWDPPEKAASKGIDLITEYIMIIINNHYNSHNNQVPIFLSFPLYKMESGSYFMVAIVKHINTHCSHQKLLKWVA